MKKVLSTLLLTIIMLSGKAQAPSIWFNEVMPRPAGNDDEYIEFYNTSTNDISLDCYIVVSYFKSKQGEDAIYVYNFPNETIKALSHYLISSDSPIGYKGNGSEYTPKDPTSFSNWNEGDNLPINQYIYKNGSWGNAQPVGNNFNNFMDDGNGNDASLFLFRINNDGSTSYVNGFVANAPGSDVPAFLQSIKRLGSLSIITDGPCVPTGTQVWLNLNGLSPNNTDVVEMNQATGSGNGYAKKGDGYCGSWEKTTQGEFSPGTKNIFPNTPSNFTSVENYYCNNVVSFSIQSATTGFFPIQVELYQDNGTTTGSYDTGDNLIGSKVITSAGSDYFTIPVTNNTQPLLLVYKSAMGCFNKIVPLTQAATPTVTMTGTISCTPNANNRRTVTYSISSVSTAAVFPFTLVATDDNGTEITSDDRQIQNHTITVNSIPFTFTTELSNEKSNVTLSIQSSPISCLSGNLQVTNGCSVLPVHFRSFFATRSNQKKEQVILKWETATEQNNRGFNVQRKTSGEWKNIAFVASKASKGNSNSIEIYEYTDINNFTGSTQYRLQQIDIDGKTSISDVRSVMNTEAEAGIIIYPNPGINGKVNLQFKGQNAERVVLVSDFNGQLIQQFPQVRNNFLAIEGLSKGFYTIKIIDRSTMITTVEKVIIQ